MKREKLEQIRRDLIAQSQPYLMCYWDEFDFSILKYILWKKKSGRGDNKTYNDCIIMADTETSKKDPSGVHENHVVAWTISIRAFDRNLVTLWGRKPSDMVSCFDRIHKSMTGEITFIYWHNMSYDFVFLRRFLFDGFGFPEKQLNTKPYFPIYVKFNNGIIMRDSLILAQRSLYKWAKDMNVKHQKAVGKWDYDKPRNQDETFTDDELEYIEHDTLAGVECIQATMDALGKHIFSMPYTATGIPREEIRTRGKAHHAHEWFLRLCPTWEQYLTLVQMFHGGYTHGNRHYLSRTIFGIIECRDFASSYPYCILSEKYPGERFSPRDNCSIDYILKNAENYAYMFKLILYKFKLRNDFIPMPALQASKCVKDINLVQDNGRVLAGAYAEIYLNEVDLETIAEQYDYEKAVCVEVQVAVKKYLPRWITDYVFELFEEKQKLKGGDPVLYALAKARLNSIYGLFAQRSVRENITEVYEDFTDDDGIEHFSGEYRPEEKDMEAEYTKYINRKGSVLPYFVGCWVTSYAMRNLFRLGKCVDYENGGIWLYSDTDSIYATKWNEERLSSYNESCKEKLRANGYGRAHVNGLDYWLGVAEKDKVYTEFRMTGAKRYCGRDQDDGELHITVAGVPKRGAGCLEDNIENFRVGFIFPGSSTGKKQHTHFYNEIYIDENGNETGDSIDLSPCDYLLGAAITEGDWERLFQEEISIQVYDEEDLI